MPHRCQHKVMDGDSALLVLTMTFALIVTTPKEKVFEPHLLVTCSGSVGTREVPDAGGRKRSLFLRRDLTIINDFSQ